MIFFKTIISRFLIIFFSGSLDWSNLDRLSAGWSAWFSLTLFPSIFKIQIKEEYSNSQNEHFERTSIQKFRPLSKNRPGRKAKLADSELSPAELEKREVRRVRNKQAARRCRQRRLEKTYNLEQKVSFSPLIEGIDYHRLCRIVEKLVNGSVQVLNFRRFDIQSII